MRVTSTSPARLRCIGPLVEAMRTATDRRTFVNKRSWPVLQAPSMGAVSPSTSRSPDEPARGPDGRAGTRRPCSPLPCSPRERGGRADRQAQLGMTSHSISARRRASRSATNAANARRPNWLGSPWSPAHIANPRQQPLRTAQRSARLPARSATTAAPNAAAVVALHRGQDESSRRDPHRSEPHKQADCDREDPRDHHARQRASGTARPYTS